MIVTSISPLLRIGLQFLGVWPNVSHSTIYWLIYMSSILIIQYFQYLYVFAHFEISEIPNLVDGLPVTLNYSLTFFKLISFWIHRRVVHQILTAINDDWHECMNIKQHLYVMTINANISNLCCNAMLSLNILATLLYLLSDYVIRFVHLVQDYNDTLRQFPIKIEFPFETMQSPSFELLVIPLFVHVFLNAFTVTTLNGLIISLVLHVSGQIDIICEEFKSISEKITFYKSSVLILGIIIKKHNKVISFSDNIENLFSFIAMIQVVWNTLIICCLGFIIVVSVNSEGSVLVLVKTTLAYIAVMTEAFIFCFAGEYLSLKSKSIADAAYDSLWYDMPTNHGKIIILLIMRSQRRLTITAGKVMDLSLEAFASIIKASASYISVFYAVY